MSYVLLGFGIILGFFITLINIVGALDVIDVLWDLVDSYTKAVVIYLIVTVLGFAMWVIPLTKGVIQDKQDTQEVFALTEGKQITDVEYVEISSAFNVGRLSFTYMDKDKEATYEKNDFHGEVTIEVSADGNYHIGTKEERYKKNGRITIFGPEVNQSDLYVSE